MSQSVTAFLGEVAKIPLQFVQETSKEIDLNNLKLKDLKQKCDSENFLLKSRYYSKNELKRLLLKKYNLNIPEKSKITNQSQIFTIGYIFLPIVWYKLKWEMVKLN